MKIEQIHKDPSIILLYDIVNDNEIETLKHLAIPEVCKQNVTFFS